MTRIKKLIDIKDYQIFYLKDFLACVKKDPFITYEESDLEYLLYFGIAIKISINSLYIRIRE